MVLTCNFVVKYMNVKKNKMLELCGFHLYHIEFVIQKATNTNVCDAYIGTHTTI